MYLFILRGQSERKIVGMFNHGICYVILRFKPNNNHISYSDNRGLFFYWVRPPTKFKAHCLTLLCVVLEATHCVIISRLPIVHCAVLRKSRTPYPRSPMRSFRLFAESTNVQPIHTTNKTYQNRNRCYTFHFSTFMSPKIYIHALKSFRIWGNLKPRSLIQGVWGISE
jgi:hypothetical protein